MTTQPTSYEAHWMAAMRGGAIGTVVYNMLNDLEDNGVAASARLEVSVQPVTTNTVTIGADVYEFVTASGAVADDANIAVAIGAAASDTRDNLILAINAADANNTHANITNIATTAPALANGTENLLADEVGTDVRIRSAASPGGAVVAANPSIVLAEAITDVADVWQEGNVNLNTLGGQAAVVLKRTHAVITVTAAMISNTLLVSVPFTPTRFSVQVITSAGVVIGTTSADTFAVSGDGVLVTFGGGIAPDIQATDILHLEISE